MSSCTVRLILADSRPSAGPRILSNVDLNVGSIPVLVSSPSRCPSKDPGQMRMSTLYPRDTEAGDT